MNSIVRRFSLPLFLFLLLDIHAAAQKKEKCGTMQLLEMQFRKDPTLKARMARQEAAFEQAVEARLRNKAFAKEQAAPVLVPVVFHIVLSNPSLVTDAQIQAQLDTINRDYAGLNGDSVHIPSYFKALFGKSQINFCLAQRNPNGEPTTGIIRATTSQSSFTIDDKVKHAETGGDNAWDPTRYLNVWVCNLSGGYLGYGTFPGMGNLVDQGVVIHYGSVPGGFLTGYNEGKTLTHEIGHYFNLYHVWGDDGGACTGTDYVDDTPNQADATSGCPSGVKTDACSPTPPGILYQDYMDYSDDACLVMFTNGQVARMETALNSLRVSLLTSDGCQPVVLKSNDAAVRAILQPESRLCNPGFTPAITLYNRGSSPLTSVTILAQVDNGSIVATPWTGNLASLGTTTVTLSALTAPTGNHVLTVYTSTPNGVADENSSNDTLHYNIMYFPPFNPPIAESFEGSNFPPDGWDIVNPDGYYTWQKVTGVSKTGQSSVFIDNYDYSINGQQDYLRLPQVNIANVDSAFISFQVAAATYTEPTTLNNTWDTLEVLVSTDCGATYTSVYKKWGSLLVTHPGATTKAYVPTSTEWRKDSIDISSFIGAGTVLLAFRNTTEYENNIYLDDINVRTVTVNPNLKAKGFLVTPSPTSGQIAVQFYPQPKDLKAIVIYSSFGQKVLETDINLGEANNYYSYDLSRFAPGVYIIRAFFQDRVVTNKVVLTR
ncbi:MAG TPA: M43 family zinc metalloprotease [Chitinophagaceae bacterium]|nr:M43 family zinc metalloprotease [Chitinophagaceae bacterium]